MARPFSLVDVFAERPFSGNPLAVVGDGSDLDSGEMLAITRWLNLSETTFLLPPTDPGADYRVRIFTPERELPFAGHPTLGSCHAWLSRGGVPRDPACIVQQCALGRVPIRRTPDDGLLAFAAPPRLRAGPLEEPKLAELCAVLQIDPAQVVDHQWLDNGPGWAGLLLGSAEAVRAVRPQRELSERIKAGIIGPTGPSAHFDVGLVGAAGSGGADWEVRALFTNHLGTLVEDPVTGSLNAAVAQWLVESGRARLPYVAAQGQCVGRDGRIFVSAADGALWIGGHSWTLFEGHTAGF